MQQSSLIECVYTTEDALYLSYMPFVKGGGLFIRTKHPYTLREAVHLSIQLFQEPERFEVDAQVVWITPKGAQGNKAMGVGVQFTSENNRQVANKIETFLAGMLKSTRMTDTL